MPRTSAHEAKRGEVIRLRVEDRKGAAEIGRITGVPKSVLNYWLSAYPLTNSEKAAIITAAPRYRMPKKVLPGGAGEACALADSLTTLGLGTIAENFVKYDISRYGLRLMKPDGDGDVVDLYVRRPGGEKVAFLQIRMTSKPPARNGLPTISLRRYRNGKSNIFKRGDFHFIVGFCPDNQKCYIYSYDEVAHLVNSVTISEDGCGAWDKVLKWLDSSKVETAGDLPRTSRRKAVASPRATAAKRLLPAKRRVAAGSKTSLKA